MEPSIATLTDHSIPLIPSIARLTDHSIPVITSIATLTDHSIPADHSILTDHSIPMLPSVDTIIIWPRSAVGNVSGNRCESDCRYRVASSIPARSHTFVEIDHEIISTVILLLFAESFKKGCCQLQAILCARSTGQLLVQACPGKSVVR